MKSRVMLILLLLLNTGAESLYSGFSTDVINSKGEVKALNVNTGEWKDLKHDSDMEIISLISTGKDSYAKIRISESGEILINEETTFEINPRENQCQIDLLYGSLKAKLEDIPSQELKIRTPVSVAAVRGTEYAVVYEEKNAAHIEVYEGSVDIFSVIKEKEQEQGYKAGRNTWIKVLKGENPEYAGEITGKQRLRWEHLETKIKYYNNIRERRGIEMKVIRLNEKLRSEDRINEIEVLSEKIEDYEKNKQLLKKEGRDLNNRLNALKDKYIKIREKNIDARLKLIHKQREEIIKRRQIERKRQLEEREKRLQELRDERKK